MNLYEKYVLPPLLNCACGLSLLKSHRKDIVPRAKGVVLEIGIGSSLNTDFYNFDQITEINGLDPNESLLKIARDNNSNGRHKINLTVGTSILCLLALYRRSVTLTQERERFHT